MSSELFEISEDDLKQICDSVRRKLTEQMPKLTGESQKQLCRELERSLEEAVILIQKMETELRKAPHTYRNSMLTKVRNYNRDIEQLTRDLKRVSSGMGRLNDQQSRCGFGGDNMQSSESSQRARLMEGTASLQRGSDSVARSHQVAAETDQIADDVITDLGTQRESLLRTRDRLHETDTNLSRSRKIVNTMMRRALTNKMILAGIILLELCILGVVIWWKFFKKKK